VANGQTSADVLTALEQASDPARGEQGTQRFVTSVAMRCLEASGSARYYESRVLSDGLVEHYDRTGDPIAGAAGYYIRSLVQFMQGQLDASLESVATVLTQVPAVNAEQYGAMAAFQVLPYGVAGWAHAARGDIATARATLADGIAVGMARSDGFSTAVLRTAEIQVEAMAGRHDGMADRADAIHTELTQLGVDQFVPGARMIRDWARAMGPDGADTSDDIRASLNEHAEGGRRIFAAFYMALLSDVEAARGRPAAARTTLRRARRMATATGEKVWESQLSARELNLQTPPNRTQDG
jgi:ATP/maltotriose-dependent transcriptional regulator MalT